MTTPIPVNNIEDKIIKKFTYDGRLLLKQPLGQIMIKFHSITKEITVSASKNVFSTRNDGIK